MPTTSEMGAGNVHHAILSQGSKSTVNPQRSEIAVIWLYTSVFIILYPFIFLVQILFTMDIEAVFVPYFYKLLRLRTYDVVGYI